MPHYYFDEIWTLFKFVGIRLFRDDDGGIWIQILEHEKRRRLRS